MAERAKRRKAQIRSALVLMPIVNKLALSDEGARRVLSAAISQVVRPNDLAALARAGYAVPKATVQTRSFPDNHTEAELLKNMLDRHYQENGSTSEVTELVLKWESLTGDAWPAFSSRARHLLGLPPHPKAPD